MSNPSLATSKDSRPFKGALLPLANHLLLIPSLLMVETIGAHHKLTQQTNAPQWCSEVVEWNGLSIPVVNFEDACHLPSEEQAEHSRLVVVNTVSGDQRLPLLAIKLYGIPSGIDLLPTMLLAINQTNQPWILNEVRIGNMHAIIPNLVAMEQAILARLF